MDLENLYSALEVGQAELDLPIESTRTSKCRIKRVRSIRSHEHFDVTSGVETIQLVYDLKHCSLDL